MFRNIVLTTLSAILMLFPFARVSLGGSDLPPIGFDVHLQGPALVAHLTVTQPSIQRPNADVRLVGTCGPIPIDEERLDVNVGNLTLATAESFEGKEFGTINELNLGDCWPKISPDAAVGIIKVLSFSNTGAGGDATINADVLILVLVPRE